MQHSRDYSASASSRWLNCTGSVVAVREYQDKGSCAAMEGTAAHNLGELCLKSDNLIASDFIGKSLPDTPSVVVDKEMARYVQGYIDYCDSFEGDHFVEIKVSYEHVAEGGFGTSDFIAIDYKYKKIICVDLKYGKGIEVSAIDNTQAQLYALGVVNEYAFLYDFNESWTIEMHIYQPRISNFSEWSISYSELMLFAEYVRERVILSKQPDAPFNPSEKACQWCSHKANCIALMKHTEKIICSQFEDLDLPDASTVNVKLVLDNKKLIESWLKAVEQNVTDKLNNGEKVTGFKLVTGRGSRKWTDESKAHLELLSGGFDDDELQTRKFISVAQAEKLVGKADFSDYSEYVNKLAGKPTLAPESDKRASIDNVSNCFENIS